MKSRQVEQYVRSASLTPNSIAIPKSASTGSDLDKRIKFRSHFIFI